MLTRRGFTALISMAAMFVLADLVGFRVLYLLFASLGLVFAISYLQIRRSPRHLASWRQIEPNPCLEGSLVRTRASVAQRGRIPGLVMRVREMIPIGLDLEADQRVSSLVASNVRLEQSVRTERRGVFSLGPLLVTISDTFGLLDRNCEVGGATPLVVYPRYLPIRSIKGRAATEILGISTTGEKGASTDFLRIRAFQPGDELKTIHWRSSAKLGRLVVREFEREETRFVTIVLNCEEQSNRGPEDGLFERGVKVAASIAVQALRENVDVRMVLYGGEASVVGRGRGEIQYHRVLSALARVQPHGNIPLWSVLQGLARDESRGSSMYIISPTIRQADIDASGRLQGMGISPFIVLTRMPDEGSEEMMVARGMEGQGRLGLAELRAEDVAIRWIT